MSWGDGPGRVWTMEVDKTVISMRLIQRREFDDGQGHAWSTPARAFGSIDGETIRFQGDDEAIKAFKEQGVAVLEAAEQQMNLRPSLSHDPGSLEADPQTDFAGPGQL